MFTGMTKRYNENLNPITLRRRTDQSSFYRNAIVAYRAKLRIRFIERRFNEVVWEIYVYQGCYYVDYDVLLYRGVDAEHVCAIFNNLYGFDS